MATQVQFRRGTTADISTFIGADGEVVVDTTKKVCVIHDGVQVAGYPLLREDGSNSALSVGSLSNCALKFVNDPNTGIISPGADQVALVTGGSSRLSIDSAGSVTIPGNLLVSGSITGSITFDNGSAGLPAVRFTNDPDTGIYLAGTNQLAISTGGSGQVFVSSNGNLGIGTLNATNAAGKIHSRADGNEAKSLLLLQNRDAGASAGSAINFVNGSFDFSDNRYSYIRSIVTGAGQNGNHLIFGTNADGAAPQERLRITSAGLVGVGTSSPSDPFHIAVSGANSANIRLQSGDGRTYNVGSTGSGYGSSGKFIIYDITAGAERFCINGSGSVGIGATSPAKQLHIESTSSDVTLRIGRNGYVQTDLIGSTGAGANDFKITQNGFDRFVIEYGGNSAARIDSSGRLLVGTSSDLSGGVANTSFQLAASSGSGVSTLAQIYSFNSGGGVAALDLCRSKSTTLGTNTTVANNDYIGSLNFKGANGSSYLAAASVSCEIDGAVSGGGAADMPGRLVFSTTADGASSPTERMRITQAGYAKISNSGSYLSATGLYHEFRQTLNDTSFYFTSTNTSYAAIQMALGVDRAATSSYSFLSTYSDNAGASDREFNLRGDGNGFCDGAWTGGGADYAEYFEWSDENPDAEDRRGISVVLDGDKIREAQTGDDPIGVISGNPSVVGDAAWNKWSGKYLRDEYGTYIQEDYEVTDEDGNTVIQQRRKLNPAYDPDVEYISREQRPEWDCVGLVGKLRIRKGQVTGSRWIKMRDINDSVEEWLVR